MDVKKIRDLMRRRVNSRLKKNKQSFIPPSKMRIIYKGFSEEISQHVFEVKVTGINATFYEGIGTTILTVFDVLSELGFLRDGETNAQVLDDGDTYIYTYYLSSEAAEKLLNP